MSVLEALGWTALAIGVVMLIMGVLIALFFRTGPRPPRRP